MLRSYFILAFRQLGRNRLYTFLNIGGLAVGLAVSAYIGLYVWHEFHYDRFHPQAERTYRILSAAKFGDDEVFMTGMHESLGREIKRQLPEVEQVVRMSSGIPPARLQRDREHVTRPESIGFADASALTALGIELAQGDPRTALSEPGRILLTQPLAETLFGSEDPVGQTITYDKKHSLTISGILRTLPTNSIFQFDALISLPTVPMLGQNKKEMWEAAGWLDTYLVVQPGTDVPKLTAKLKKVDAGIRFHDIKATYLLEALPALHLHGRQVKPDVVNDLYLFLGIALLILALAITNYVSLTTARATQRAREVGVRKAIGGVRAELIKQFYTESVLTTTLAFGLGLGLLVLLLPFIDKQLGIRMDGRLLGQPAYWLLLGSLWAATALLSGSYPALLLSGFRPQDALKNAGGSSSRLRGVGVRRVLTTGQFAASAGLLMCSLVFYAQMRYLRTRNIGLDRAQVVAVQIDRDMAPQFTAFREAVRQWAGADRVATVSSRLYTPFISTFFLNTKKTKKQVMMNVLTVDAAFFKTLGIGWKLPPVGWGKQPITKELTAYNEQAIRETGETVRSLPHPDPFTFNGGEVAGITRDFNLFGLRQAQTPVMLTVVSDTSRAVVAGGGYLLVRLNPAQDVPVAMGQLKLLYEQAQRGPLAAPFDFYFLDDAYNKLYQRETQLAMLVNGFTGLTLLVAVLGLLGLMTFTVEARTKEIGIRKVLGATVASIVALLSRELLLLVALAVLVAAPVAWWAMNKWLAGFAYHIDVPAWVFWVAGTLSLLVALLTVAYQSLRAALANPTRALRSE
jgi:putative ABC transport system permease protein